MGGFKYICVLSRMKYGIINCTRSTRDRREEVQAT